MAEHLSRQAQYMLACVFKDCEPSFAKDRVTIRGVTFLLNNRAIAWLNQEAAETRGQFPLQATDRGAEKV